MSKKIISFDELQNWDCAEDEFGGIYNDGNGFTHIIKKTYSYPSEWNTDNKKQKYTKEKLQELWKSYIKKTSVRKYLSQKRQEREPWFPYQ